MTEATIDEPEAPPAPTMTPERARYVRGALVATSTALLDLLVSDLLGAQSTEGSSRQERLIYGALKPLLPRLRALFLGKLSEADPAGLERLIGSLATAIEQILAQAPDEPLPRWRWEWQPGEPAPRLVPDAWHGSAR